MERNTLGERFSLTHEEIANRIAKSRSSITETLSLRTIPDAIKAQCALPPEFSPSPSCSRPARQPTEARMRDPWSSRFELGLVNREQARSRAEHRKKAPPCRLQLRSPGERVQADSERPQMWSGKKSWPRCDVSSRRWRPRVDFQSSPAMRVQARLMIGASEQRPRSWACGFCSEPPWCAHLPGTG